MYRSLLLHNTSLWVLGAGLRALRYHIGTLYDSLLLINQDFEHLTLVAFVLAGEDNHLITFLDM